MGPALRSVLHHPARIAILTRLHLFRSLRFSRLRALVEMTPGNLSSHIAVLEKNGIVATRTRLFDRGPGQVIELTDVGRQALAAYAEELARLLATLRADGEGQPLPGTQVQPREEV